MPDRGGYMGNRGVLHDDKERIVRFSQGRRWICCLTDFKGRTRRLMTPGNYTELFFLDEATALAAGHRPCHECRRSRAREFQNAWVRATGAEGPVSADVMDRALHADRLEARGRMRRWEAETVVLPTGAMIEHEGSAFLVTEGRIRRWSFGGYDLPEAPVGRVTVLTPRSIVATLGAGYAPELHPSAVSG